MKLPKALLASAKLTATWRVAVGGGGEENSTPGSCCYFENSTDQVAQGRNDKT